MTTIRLGVLHPTGTAADDRSTGSVEWVPSARRVVGADVVLPDAFLVTLSATADVTVAVAPTSTAWVWRVLERVSGGSGTWRYLAVPDSVPTVDYATLVEVDPATLDPITTAPTVAAELAAEAATARTNEANASLLTTGTVADARLPVTSQAATVAGKAAHADVQTFTSNGTWTKPAGAIAVDVFLLSAGSGGGAGARGPSGTALSGGGGGAGGGVANYRFLASQLTPTVAIILTAAGTGAAGQTTNGTAGATGTGVAAASKFGSYLNGPRCSAGGVGGGLAAAGTGATGALGWPPGANGGAGSAAGAAGTYSSQTSGAPGGGGGGGITTAPLHTAGGNGSASNVILSATATGGAAGGTAGANGDAGPGGLTGSSGAGGGGNTGGPGGAGGNGAYGAGGGGGGASLDGSVSGKGGDGGSGLCVVTTYF